MTRYIIDKYMFELNVRPYLELFSSLDVHYYKGEINALLSKMNSAVPKHTARVLVFYGFDTLSAREQEHTKRWFEKIEDTPEQLVFLAIANLKDVIEVVKSRCILYAYASNHKFESFVKNSIQMSLEKENHKGE